MKIFLILLFWSLPVMALCQSNDQPASPTDDYQWLTSLAEKGVEMTKDSIIISKEFQTLLQDEQYRATIFPQTYTWEAALQFIQDKELKKAFWYFINLYPVDENNKKLVVRSILAYERLFKMDQILINTFYTYCFIDPEVNTIKDGITEVAHPDILEAKLRNVKEIVGYILTYRKQQEKEKKI